MGKIWISEKSLDHETSILLYRGSHTRFYTSASSYSLNKLKFIVQNGPRSVSVPPRPKDASTSANFARRKTSQPHKNRNFFEKFQNFFGQFNGNHLKSLKNYSFRPFLVLLSRRTLSVPTRVYSVIQKHFAIEHQVGQKRKNFSLLTGSARYIEIWSLDDICEKFLSFFFSGRTVSEVVNQKHSLPRTAMQILKRTNVEVWRNFLQSGSADL